MTSSESAGTGRHTVAEAAAILRCKESWLRENLYRFPHCKRGRAVTFTDAHLAEIDRLTEVDPTRRNPAAASGEATVLPLEHIVPTTAARGRPRTA